MKMVEHSPKGQKTLWNKSGKLLQHTPVLPQVAMAKFNYKKQQRAITHKLSKQEL